MSTYYERNRDKAHAYYRDNREARLEYNRAYRARNKDEINARRREKEIDPVTQANRTERNRKWREHNPDRVIEYKRRAKERKYYDLYRAEANAGKARRRSLKRSATPLDADKKEILSFYRMARILTEITGQPYHVDHMIPLSRGGRHHQDNLAVVTAEFNLWKKNRIHPDVLDLLLRTKPYYFIFNNCRF